MNIDSVMKVLAKEYRRFPQPSVTQISISGDPYKVLISCLISLRTKDAVTFPASQRLFALADTPHSMVRLSLQTIEKAIYPAAFYRVKSQRILDISRLLIISFGGKVPSTMEELLALPGVGRKTANLTLTLGHGKPGICVDVHVHRISNRLGLVKTKNPAETEFELRRILPKKYWISFNDHLVAYGQNVCTPVSPHCSGCRVKPLCPQVGVGKRR